MQDLNQQQWREKLSATENGVVIDVRTPSEIAEGYIPNALHMNIMDAGSFMQQTEKLDKNNEYFVYCKSGGRSAQACMIMKSLGFQKTNNLLGGFSEWNGEITL